MFRPIAQLYASTAALLEVAATLVARSATWLATAPLQTCRDRLLAVVAEAMEASVQVTVLQTTALPHATSAVDLTTTLETVKLKQ